VARGSNDENYLWLKLFLEIERGLVRFGCGFLCGGLAYLTLLREVKELWSSTFLEGA
jgi:hypothetical protein